MTGINNHIKDLIVRHFINDLTPEETKQLEQLILDEPRCREYFQELQEIWFSTINTESFSKYDAENAFNSFKQRVAESSSRRLRKQLKWLKYAAAAVLLISASYLSYRHGITGIRSNFSDIAIEVPAGSRMKMSLPDGSLVWLNAGSRIMYSQGFGVEEREVSIEGEGYFEVKKNEHLPFHVISGNLNLEVLGTKFNFRDYYNDPEAIVTLAEGKVSLSNLLKNGEKCVLQPGQHAVLDKKSGRMQVSKADTSTSSQWTLGLLVFNGEPLEEIARKLERSYNVKVTISGDALKGYHFYGDFIRQEQTLREVLDDLSATGKIKYEIHGGNVTLY